MEPEATAETKGTQTMTQGKIAEGKCFQCRGDGYYWRVPDGMNPFAAGGWNTINASYKVVCFRCEGTGRALLLVKDPDGEGARKP